MDLRISIFHIIFILFQLNYNTKICSSFTLVEILSKTKKILYLGFHTQRFLILGPLQYLSILYQDIS